MVHDGKIRERHVLIVHVRNIYGFSRDKMKMFEYANRVKCPIWIPCFLFLNTIAMVIGG